MPCPYTETLADYILGAQRLTLPPDVVLRSKLHILDMLVARR